MHLDVNEKVSWITIIDVLRWVVHCHWRDRLTCSSSLMVSCPATHWPLDRNYCALITPTHYHLMVCLSLCLCLSFYMYVCIFGYCLWWELSHTGSPSPLGSILNVHQVEPQVLHFVLHVVDPFFALPSLTPLSTNVRHPVSFSHFDFRNVLAVKTRSKCTWLSPPSANIVNIGGD